jgi:cellulose synthase operon protein C
MPLFEPRFLTAALLVSVLAVSACDSPEERAENHFQRGVELMSAGETDRALIEFRNVLEQDQNHTRGRLELARVLRSQGDTGGAIAQYLRLVELDPENAAAQPSWRNSRSRCRTSRRRSGMPNRPMRSTPRT